MKKKRGQARKIKVLTVIGTRPEVIKMAPVIKELEQRRARFSVTNVLTGQHREMSRPYLSLFKIRPHHDLAIMRRGQSLDGIVERILQRFPPVLQEVRPDIVLVQGDTTSAFAAALAAYHQQIAVGHVEAGLRTNNKYNPYPEELNRRLIGTLADLHFAPTQVGQQNLLREGVAAANIFVTGNTVIDALMSVAQRPYKFTDPVLANIPYASRRVICVTTHRRESFGLPMRNALKALRRLAERFADVEIVIPVHYNPNVRAQVFKLLGGVSRIHLIAPLPYEAFVHLMNRSYLIVTDSGGVQEEAPALGKPVLVMRETTERPEGVKAGTAKLVGTHSDTIVNAAAELLEQRRAYRAMAQAVNPYGDGQSSRRIANILEKRFSRSSKWA